jgi:L-ribulose-5-phosphate 3-epimerase
VNNTTSFIRPFGIVQGRLTVPPAGQLQWFPQDSWREEFVAAERVGIAFIELLTERDYNPGNPAWSPSGRDEIKAISRSTGRSLYSICTDYIIDHPLLEDARGATAAHVRMFLEAAAELGCEVAVFPLLEQSNLTPASAGAMVPLIKGFARQAAKSGMLICIESLLDGAQLRAFLEQVGEPNVKCVFDTGNRVLDNPDLAPEIRLLGGWIAHVHIKDKNAAGQNVLLGTGRVNFAEVFAALKGIGYGGPLVFETTRGKDPMETARYHMATCNFFSREASLG